MLFASPNKLRKILDYCRIFKGFGGYREKLHKHLVAVAYSKRYLSLTVGIQEMSLPESKVCRWRVCKVWGRLLCRRGGKGGSQKEESWREGLRVSITTMSQSSKGQQQFGVLVTAAYLLLADAGCLFYCIQKPKRLCLKIWAVSQLDL